MSNNTVVIGTDPSAKSTNFIQIDVDNLDKIIHVDSRFTAVRMKKNVTVNLDGIVLSISGDFVKNIQSVGNVVLNLDLLPKLEYFHVDELTADQAKYIPIDLEHLSFNRLAKNDAEIIKSLERLYTLKSLVCGETPDILPPNIEKLKYNSYTGSIFPESINEIYCNTGFTNALPTNLETLTILISDPILQDLESVCPSLHNLTICMKYDWHREPHDNGSIFGEEHIRIFESSRCSMEFEYGCDIIEHGVFDRMPKSIRKICSDDGFSFGDYNFSKFIDLEMMKCAYSNFTPPPNLKTLILDLDNNSCFWDNQEAIDHFFSKFNYLETLNIPMLTVPLVEYIKDSCMIGTLFISFGPECCGIDFSDIPCRMVIIYTAYVSSVYVDDGKPYQFHSRNVIEIIDSPDNIYIVECRKKKTIHYESHIRPYQFISRGEIVNPAGYTVPVIRAIVPGEYVNSKIKSARK